MATEYSPDDIEELRKVLINNECYGHFHDITHDFLSGKGYSSITVETRVQTYVIAGIKANDLLRREKEQMKEMWGATDGP